MCVLNPGPPPLKAAAPARPVKSLDCTHYDHGMVVHIRFRAGSIHIDAACPWGRWLPSSMSFYSFTQKFERTLDEAAF